MPKESAEQVALKTLIGELRDELAPILSIPRVWLAEGEAADYLRLSVHSLRSWRSKGTGPDYFKIQGRVVYGKDVLDGWVQKHRVKGDR